MMDGSLEVGGERVFIGLGSNLGDRRAHLVRALAFLEADVEIALVRVSSLYETPPMGPPGQASYLNAVAELRTRLSPRALLQRLKAYERAAGRTPGPRWGARIIDLDILVYGELEVREPDLTIPHPGVRQRAFVLVPLAELEPALRLPGDDEPVRGWRDRQPDRDGVVWIDGPPGEREGR